MYKERFRKMIDVRENAKVVEKYTAMIRPEYD